MKTFIKGLTLGPILLMMAGCQQSNVNSQPEYDIYLFEDKVGYQDKNMNWWFSPLSGSRTAEEAIRAGDWYLGRAPTEESLESARELGRQAINRSPSDDYPSAVVGIVGQM